jgi:hypothetical protein
LDVHAPHEPIHSVRDFLLHLLTITVGLLIAVGIEGCVELHREHTLVREARATMREEIAHNAKSMVDETAELGKQTVAIDTDIQALQRVQANPRDKDAQHASINANFSMQGLNQTAWKTAQTTGALSFMPYDEAQRYAGVYQLQEDFLGEQSKILDDEAQFLGVMAKTNFGHGDLTPEQAGLALERFGVWKGHLSYLHLMAKVCLATDQAFLAGKEAPKSMSTEFH